MKRALEAVVTIVSVLWGIYAALTSWQLALPSASFLPHDPFAAVFSLTNSGYLSATSVEVERYRSYVHYKDPINGYTNMPSAPIPLGDLGRNEFRTFLCPQSVSAVTVWNRALTPGEVEKEYEESLAHPSSPDMPFDLADFEFRVKYSPSPLPLHWTTRYRVVGRPRQNGAFVLAAGEP
jgi:hypothetical protein